MATVDLGKISFVNKGTYDASTTYEERDVVQFTDGALSSCVYINATPASGQTPSTGGTVNSSHWSIFAGGVSIALGNNKLVTTNSSGTLIGTSIGSVGQAVKVTSSNTLGFGQAGGIAQVKQFINNGEFTTSSNSFVNTGLITATFDNPIASGSKVLLQLETSISEDQNGAWARGHPVTVFEGSTNIGTDTFSAFRTLHAATGGYSGNSVYFNMMIYGSVLHTPSSTTPSYTIRMHSDSGGGSGWNITMGSARSSSSSYNWGGTRLTIYEVTV